MRSRILWLAAVGAAFGCLVLPQSESAAVRDSLTPPLGALHIGLVGNFDSIDPAIAYGTTSWQLEYSTCAKLLNYPDSAAADGKNLQPEIAAAMPTVSPDGLTYTFQIRDDYAFSPPAGGFVTASSMKYSLERTMSGALGSPGYSFLTDIEGAQAYHDGTAQDVSGIVADDNNHTLSITLVQPEGDFLARLAMPFSCAVPIGFSPGQEVINGPIPSAGPYYISSRTPNATTIALRNPNYTGPRPANFDSIEYSELMNVQTCYDQTLAGTLDIGCVPPAETQNVIDQYGPDSAAAAHGLQQWFSSPAPCTFYVAMNTERTLFSDPNMRKAVNYALDRSALAAIRGPGGGVTVDKFIPPDMPGYRSDRIYPDTPDLVTARDLAGWHPGDPMRDAVLYYQSAGSIGPPTGQAVHDELLQIGINATMVGFTGFNLYTRLGHHGEPFDLGVGVGWCRDYEDPFEALHLFDGTTIQDDGNIDLSYFNDPVFNQRIHDAQLLPPATRAIRHSARSTTTSLTTLRRSRTSTTARQRLLRAADRLPGASAGVQRHRSRALCLRPEGAADDLRFVRPESGTMTAHIQVHLGSEMDQSVTVDYATADGTAHAGEDYDAISGTLTFAPHERTKTSTSRSTQAAATATKCSTST